MMKAFRSDRVFDDEELENVNVLEREGNYLTGAVKPLLMIQHVYRNRLMMLTNVEMIGWNLEYRCQYLTRMNSSRMCGVHSCEAAQENPCKCIS